MDEITGKVTTTVNGDQPFRAVILRGGRVLAFRDATTLAEAERFLTQQLHRASMAEKRCGRAAAKD